MSKLANLGSPSLPIAIVRDAPDGVEIRTQEPYSSIGGKLIREGLSSAKIPLGVCRLMYLVDEQLPEPEIITIPRKGEPVWTPLGLQFVQRLRTDLASSGAKLIFTIGNAATFALTGRWGVGKWRGSILPSQFNPNVFVMPIHELKNVFQGYSYMRHLMILDMLKAAKFLDGGCQFEPRNCIIAPSFNQVMDFLDSCSTAGLNGRPVYFDIECKHLELNCISFAITPHEAMCIPLADAKGAYFNPQHEAAVLKAIGQLLGDSRIRKCGQNLIFDTHFLLRRLGLRITNLDDTMIAQHTIMHEFPKGLDMICSIYTDIPYYKEDGKEWFAGGGTYEKLWRYNCLDSIVCADAFPKMLESLINYDLLPHYERQRLIIEPCCYMMEHGIRVNMRSLEADRILLDRSAAEAREEFSRLAPGVNPQSSTQLKKLFYEERKFPEYKDKTGKVTTNALALKRLIRAGSREAQLVSQIKRAEKTASTYLSECKFDADDRIRCQYKPVGTAYTRLASSASIFGTGMNMQNWPHSMLAHLLPDPGYVMYNFDLSQAENRIVAYVGRITSMMEAFENGTDIHSLTASLIFEKPIEEISDEPGSAAIGSGLYSERSWGKKANHGLNYGLGVEAFAMLYEISSKDAARIWHGYHNAYPGVQKGFHAYIKKSINENRYVVNLLGRKTLFLSSLCDSTYKAAYSCIPQGSVGDIINERGMEYVYYNKEQFAELELVIQVHDSVGFQLPLSLPFTEHARMIQAIKDSLETPLTTHYGRTFRIPADCCMGLSLMKEEGIELKAKRWPATPELLTQALESNYLKLREKASERGY